MTENNEPQNSPKSDDSKMKAGARKPRGLGGVILIMCLLLALFVMISRSGVEREASVYDFYRHLFNGQIRSTIWTEGRVIAEVNDPAAPQQQQRKKIDVVLDRSLVQDSSMVKELLPYELDLKTYAPQALAQFASDFEDGTIQIQRAIFVTDLPGKLSATSDSEAQPVTVPPERYLCAQIMRDGEASLVRLEHRPAGGEGPTLEQLAKDLSASNVDVLHRTLSRDPRVLKVEQQSTALIYILGTIGPWLLVLIIVWFFIIRQMRSPGGSGGVLSFGRSRAALYTKESRTNVTFEDVAGIEEAKGELREIIEFLKNPGKFAKLGGSIPRGVLLVGSPGTGKTLLAKAIAGEAEVPFYSISGSDFVEMFVGVGASRVRDLFKQARESSPCLIFLDEIDAVGRKRGSGMGGGHDEREQTLNAILVEMDGFDSDQGTILLAATNRPDVLDPALLRPGRFDRQVTIDMPDAKGREAILNVHARKIKMRPGVDMAVIARATPGFSGADLAALTNEAAILAAMNGKEFVELGDLEEARDRVRWGREKRSRAMAEEDLEVTAYHEAGHALVSSLIDCLDPVHKVTIVSRGMALGATMSLPERDDYHQRKTKLVSMIAMCYGGRIAEEIVYGDISAGAKNDIEKATELAKLMVCELGMSEVIGPINYSAARGSGFLGNEFAISPDISPTTLEMINKEVRRFCDEQYDRARKMITENRWALDKITQALLKYETLDGDEVSAIMRGDDLGEFRDARERQRKLLAPEPEAETETEAESHKSNGEPDVDLPGTEGLAHP